MKKIALSLFFIIALSILYAEEYVVYMGNGYNYNKTFNELSKINFAIKYDNTENTYYLVTSDTLKKGWIFISKEQLNIIRKNLKKYIEWEKLASDNKVILEKELPESSITTYVFWKFGDSWYSADSLVLNFAFLSQDAKRHQLCISSSKVESNGSETIDYRLNTIYLEKDQVKSFIDGISDEAVEKSFDEKKQKNKDEKIFK